MTERLHFLSFCSSFWRRNWQLTPVFLPGESHGWRGLVGYSLWGCKQLDTTKQLTHRHTDTQTHTHTHRYTHTHTLLESGQFFLPLIIIIPYSDIFKRDMESQNHFKTYWFFSSYSQSCFVKSPHKTLL